MANYVFQRNELKYIITKEQYHLLLKEIQNHLSIDQYGQTTIQSLYYDTDTYLLIRNSIERPLYKEKIRVRSYGLNDSNKDVFLELKKKANGVVFKRRVNLKENEIDDILKLGINKENKQIVDEIIYFSRFYKTLKPKILLLYDRTAYIDNTTDLRITFDKRPRYRTNNLNLHTNLEGKLLLDENKILMEIKTSNGYPLWLIKLLSENKVYKTSFSKYAAAYQIELTAQQEKIKEEKLYV